jgi:GDP-4-dehydro-6-deoxy-D-mannose reductase
MRSLVTGVAGFAGSHLAEHLLAMGDEVAGTILAGESTANIAPLGERVALHQADVRDPVALAAAFAAFRPEAVYHLAGMASVGDTWSKIPQTLEVNALGLVNVIAAGRDAGSPRVLTIGSGEVYGRIEPGLQPIGEDTPFAPLSPYALSKVWQEEAGRFFHTRGYPVFLVRPFNHTGPRQSKLFVCADFAAQLAAIEAGLREPVIRVGNLDARRDFLDVRDVVSAYRLALTRGTPGTPYNIASGTAPSIREVLDLLRGFASVPVRIEHEESRMRPSDLPILAGDSSRLRRDTGWEPRIPFERTLLDLLDFERRAIAGRP